jgi:negative regulator of sigma E activity
MPVYRLSIKALLTDSVFISAASPERAIELYENKWDNDTAQMISDCTIQSNEITLVTEVPLAEHHPLVTISDDADNKEKA